MIRAGAGLSNNPVTEHAAEEVAARAMERAGIDRADLVLTFFTADHAAAADQLASKLRAAARTDNIVGSSGAGVLTGEGEIEGRAGIAALVVSSDAIQFRSFLYQPLRAREGRVGAELAAMLPQGEDALLVAFPDAYNVEPRALFRGVEQAGFVPMVGAGSAENGALGKTFQLRSDTAATNALAGFALGGRFSAAIDITQGCQPITAPMTITKTDGNLIVEIDHRPAFEVLAGVIKGPLIENLGRALAYIFAGLPADRRRNEVGPGQYLVRNIIGLDPERGVIAVAEEIFEGERICFTLRDGERAREDLEQMLERQAARLSRKPAFGLYFNCCARGRSLYGIENIDTAFIHRALGDFPLIGLFGGFEIGPLGEKNHLFAYTGVLALIDEK
ncbi:MAG TPA: FIST N-terminal domain-containing protein [Verrucomicrobiae bacterium]|jgi:small ligand-binding sensory domain FIST|nr:FIST N-terminal domain-containing protein [Verrucomicrobiae bacterium]